MILIKIFSVEGEYKTGNLYRHHKHILMNISRCTIVKHEAEIFGHKKWINPF